MASDFEPQRIAHSTNDPMDLSNAIKDLSLNNVLNRQAEPSTKDDFIAAKVRNAFSPAPLHIPKRSVKSDFGKTVSRRASTPVLNKKSSMCSMHDRESPSTPKRVLSRQPSGIMQQSPVTFDSPRLPVQPEEIVRLTESSLAADWFGKDLDLHKTQRINADTVVILHDSCYGHRYSRPKTSKATLSMIVERPERVQASVVGVSAAYVRLGGKYSGGSEAPHPKHEPIANAPFSIQKSSRFVALGSPAITNVHGVKWMEELKAMCLSAETKLATTGRELTRSPTGSYGQSAKVRLHEGDLYLCSESLNAFQGALGGVCDGVDAVFGHGAGKRAFVCIRPPGHHCSADYPSGFCWVNNVHAGIQHAAQSYGLTHAAIIDFDLHHGDGSQSITWQHNARAAKLSKNAPSAKKVPIGYFSLHDINSYPCEEGNEAKVQSASLCVENAHGQTVWNVHLQPWKTLDEFWELYETRYITLLDKARRFLKTHTAQMEGLQGQVPKSAIFISAGFDASEWESADMQRHKVNVPTDFYARFTKDIVRLANEEGLSVDGRVISVLEGGYSDRALISGVFSHIAGLCGTSTMEGVDVAGNRDINIRNTPVDDFPIHDSDWWNQKHLEEIEAKLKTVPRPPTKIRNPSQPTFDAPTQSFTAKVVDPSKIHRSISLSKLSSPVRPASPPPPEVTWPTAIHELSKLLIPTDRQTGSCLPEELSEQRGRREKSVPPLKNMTADPSARKMQLRAKKQVKTSEDTVETQKPKVKAASRSTRRRTIAELQTTIEESPMPSLPPVPKPRRLSVASSIASTNEKELGKSLTVTAGSVKTYPAIPIPSKTDGLQLKKTRAPSQRKSEAPKPTGGKKKTSTTKLSTSRAEKFKATAMPETSKANQQDIPHEKVNDVDSLESMMKKITIRVPGGPKYEELRRQVAAGNSNGLNVSPIADDAMSSNLQALGQVVQNENPPSVTYLKDESESNEEKMSGVGLTNGSAEFRSVEVRIPQFHKQDSAQLYANHEVSSSSSLPISSLPPSSPPLLPIPSERQEQEQPEQQRQQQPPISTFSQVNPSNPSKPSSADSNSSPSPLPPQHKPQTPTPSPSPTLPESQSLQFIPYEPDNPPTQISFVPNSHTLQQQANQVQHHPFPAQQPPSLQWLPPNSESPTAQRTSPRKKENSVANASTARRNGRNLPNFTATGYIPFDGGMGKDGKGS